MFGLSPKEKYETDVLKLIADYLSQPQDKFSKALYAAYPGARTAIETGFREGRDKINLGLNIANTVVVDIIGKQADTEWRERTLLQLQDRILHPDYSWQRTVGQLRDGRYPKNIDNFVYVLEWFLAMTSRACEKGNIDNDEQFILTHEIVGALQGTDAGERQARRLSNALAESLGVTDLLKP